ncbi:hypothetical protein, partial [Aeromicrobium sp.]|uniref:phage baseplate protein n=1 Tax=Aeromicrobium sp. TaxID=1871063 RepID=UPI0019C76C4D
MTRIRQREDTASAWAAANPLLLKGEVGWESGSTPKAKKGDGVTLWNALPYAIQMTAPIDSPAFTGNPTVPTPLPSDNDTSVANTAFVKAQNYAPLASPTLTGNPTTPTPPLGDNDTSVANTAFIKAAIDAAISASMLSMFPVGSIRMSTVNTSPATALGGTWTAWGSGRVPVGVDAAQTEFDTVEGTGGAKTVTLTASNLPAHTHTIAHTHDQNTRETATAFGTSAAVAAPSASGNLLVRQTLGSNTPSS